jgi:two-component system chemotaxis sensor kinase CheA/chemotaxis protein CheC
MRVDVRSLGTFNELAHEGARAATGALGQMTGIDGSVEVTKISLLSREEVGEELVGREFVGVAFDFEGAMAGETVLVFERSSVDSIAGALVGEDPSEAMARSGVEEIGNIMMSGFIDGWADHLGATIEHSPPEYVERRGADVIPAAPEGGERGQVFVFKSEIEWVGESVSFYIYMLPEYGSLADLLVEHTESEEAIPIDKLELFNDMTRRGTERAAENVETMSGIPTEAEVTQISFAPIEDVPKQVGEEAYVGTVVEFTGTPSGFLLVLFDEASAERIAEGLLPTVPEGEGLTDHHMAAVEELGNIMTSGFVDGWANVLGTSVDHTPPRLVHDMGRAIVDPLAAQLGRHQEHAFIIDSEMRTDEVAFGAEIHAIPDERELRRALEDLDADRADETEADPEEIFG